MEKQLTMGSLFDGIGGFMLAAETCGIKPIWAAEIEPRCIGITRRHFPDVMHVGSVTELKGDEIPPVDIITFGSPCQNLSVCGNRKGLAGSESGLFFEAIRIIEEMREATNGRHPTFIIWENVSGAFSSNGGHDFRTVLEEITKTDIPMPASGQWSNAGMVRGAAVDTAWRVFNAEYWGVPQRRRRIYLVGDFGGQRAGEILFKQESMLGYLAQGDEETTKITGYTGNGVNAEGTGRYADVVLNDQGGSSISVENGKCPTLRAQTHGNLPCVVKEECISVDVAHADAVARTYTNVVPTLLRRMGTGGNQVPLIIKENVIPIRSETTGLKNSNGLGIGEEGGAAPTLTANDIHSVFYSSLQNVHYEESDVSSPIMAAQAKQNNLQPLIVSYEQAAFDKYVESNKSATLKACGGSYHGGSDNLIVKAVRKTVKLIKYIIRRLTPRECERLQGYPDDWTRWTADEVEVADTARYKAIGNSIAVPCAIRVFLGILSELKGSA